MNQIAFFYYIIRPEEWQDFILLEEGTHFLRNDSDKYNPKSTNITIEQLFTFLRKTSISSLAPERADQSDHISCSDYK